MIYKAKKRFIKPKKLKEIHILKILDIINRVVHCKIHKNETYINIYINFVYRFTDKINTHVYVHVLINILKLQPCLTTQKNLYMKFNFKLFLVPVKNLPFWISIFSLYMLLGPKPGRAKG